MKQKIAKLQKNLKIKIEELETKLEQATLENEQLKQQQAATASNINDNISQQLMTDNENLASRIAQLQAAAATEKDEKDKLATQVAEQESIMLEFATKIEEKEKDLIQQLSNCNKTITKQENSYNYCY